MLGRFEDLAIVAALALEDGRGVVQGMAEQVNLGIAPIYQRSIHPNEAIPIVIASHDGLSCLRKLRNIGQHRTYYCVKAKIP